MNKIILDACCGGRSFWFDKDNENTLFIDKRRVDPCIVGNGKNGRKFEVNPDLQMDFRNLDIESNTFKLVVFDPPHFSSLGEKSYMAKKYGKLDKNTWKDDLRKGFSECFRVLKNEGILIFKWNKHDIPLREVLSLTSYQPLFGHPSGKKQLTHWVCFMKLENSIRV